MLSLLLASAANATTIEFTIQEFIGGDSEVTFVLDDDNALAGPGNILLTATVTQGSSDLRALFFDVADDSVLDGLTVTAGTVGDTTPIINVGRGGNLRGGGESIFFDLGIEIGGPGQHDFFDTITLVISSDTLDLDLSMFSEQLFGARTTSTGRKLRGEAPFIVPEPATAALTGMGLAMLAFAGRRRRRARPSGV